MFLTFSSDDHYRVVLRAVVEFDYINASFIDVSKTNKTIETHHLLFPSTQGYRQRGAYIATQMPLKNTVNDFWKMIWEYQTRSVVVLCKMEEDVEVGYRFTQLDPTRACSWLLETYAYIATCVQDCHKNI